MPPKTTSLTGLLHEFEDLLDERGSWFSSYALPGIDDDQIDALLAPTGFAAPTELREWWRWHHGARSEVHYPGNVAIGPYWWWLMSIPQALRDRDLWIETPAADDEGWQIGQWLPFMAGDGDQPRLVARLEDSTEDLVCVGLWRTIEPPEEPVASSIAEVVATFIRALREGAIYRPPEGGWARGERWREFPEYVSA